MISARNFFFLVIFTTLSVSIAIALYAYQDKKNEAAMLIVKVTKSDLSNLSYNIYKNLEHTKDAQKLNILFNRAKASNDLIQDILLTDGQKVLVGTSAQRMRHPKKEDYFIPETMSDLEMLESQKILHQTTYIYESNTKQELHLFIILDPSEIEHYIYEDNAYVIIKLFFIAILFFIFVYIFVERTIIAPLEKLRQYAYYQSELPKHFLLRELEYIRASMFQTFQRLEHERQELYISARTDSLSGLCNRESLDEKLSLLISSSKRTKQEFALLFLDLDHFKSINDSLGHKIGDALLQQIATTIKQVVRDNDIVARIGGDEFVIVLSQYDSLMELTQVIERIQDYLKKPFIINDRLLEVTSSVGVAFYPKDGLTDTELLKNADIAMYKAKHDGRNQFHFFTQELNEKIQADIQINNEMKEALRNNEFELYYQPKTNIADGKIVGCEALIRWNHPQKGIVSPFKFIPIAERDGFIIELGAWVLKTAMVQQVAWKKAGVCDLSISVNLSVKQLLHRNFENDFKEIVYDSGISTDKLDVEIVESLFLLNTSSCSSLLTMFHDMGISVSLDDFGTGYSSLSYLKSFRINTLKIDKVFIDDYNTESGSIFLQTIIKMGQTLKLTVLCEGVETEEQLEFLKSLDCDLYQGYLCSKPIPASDFENFYLTYTSN